jgi:hypothetical protein
MPRAGHIRARPLREMLQAGPSTPSPDAVHLCKLWRLLSVTATRRSLLLTILPTARTPRCSVCERRAVTLFGGAVATGRRCAMGGIPAKPARAFPPRYCAHASRHDIADNWKSAGVTFETVAGLMEEFSCHGVSCRTPRPDRRRPRHPLLRSMKGQPETHLSLLEAAGVAGRCRGPR